MASPLVPVLELPWLAVGSSFVLESTIFLGFLGQGKEMLMRAAGLSQGCCGFGAPGLPGCSNDHS